MNKEVVSRQSSVVSGKPAIEHSRLTTRNSQLAKRHRAERRFRLYGLLALGFAGAMLLLLIVTVGEKGVSGFTRHEVKLEIDTAPIAAALNQDPSQVDFYQLTQQASYQAVHQTTPDAKTKHAVAEIIGFFASAAVKKTVLHHSESWGKTIPVWVPLSDIGDLAMKGSIARDTPAELRPISDMQLQWLDQWKAEHRIRRAFNSDFFTHGDSRAPEAAGFLGSMVGAFITLVICMGAALPVAVMAAITLEEFARKTRVAEWLEIAINNLAAVPSIIYGLLGLTVFIQFFGMPRSSPLVGGLTLALLVMPVMIIAARAAIRAVPPSMRQAATALGATRLQVVRHHVLPYALPGIMTGTILSIARAIGETAPLLMIGMVAFVADVPRSALDAATSMPVQIYIWAASPQLGYAEKTSAGIIVLLLMLLALNWAAIRLRKKSQQSWS